MGSRDLFHIHSGVYYLCRHPLLDGFNLTISKFTNFESNFSYLVLSFALRLILDRICALISTLQ